MKDEIELVPNQMLVDAVNTYQTGRSITRAYLVKLADNPEALDNKMTDMFNQFTYFLEGNIYTEFAKGGLDLLGEIDEADGVIPEE